jgi:hypothetical protein
MTTMVSTPLRCLRGSVVATLGCMLVMATALIGGCSRTIDGTVHAAATRARPDEPIPVADLLIGPGGFPARYPAAVLEPGAVDRALREIDGVAAGSVVTPPGCAPPVAPKAAVVRGADRQNASSLIVAVSRPGASLRARIDQLAGCSSFTSVLGEESSSVTVTALAAPPVDADDSYAVDQTVTSTASDSMRRMLVLVAQIADVRISAIWLQDGTRETTPSVTPDTESLDTVFTEAVLKVRRDDQP